MNAGHVASLRVDGIVLKRHDDNTMDRMHQLSWLWIPLFLAMGQVLTLGENPRPNVLVILADDCTRSDLRLYGGKMPSLLTSIAWLMTVLCLIMPI